MMTAQDCLQILRDLKDAAFATVDQNGLPQVRIIDVMLTGHEKLYFCTARGKDFYRELCASGEVAVTGMNSAYQMVRLSGHADRLSDQKEWINRIFEANPSMKSVYPGNSRFILEPFCVENGKIEFFDLGKTPIYRQSFSIGTAEKKEKGYQIGSACVGCGICKKACPQQCIDAGTPYRIRQENCLHCGLCFESCPQRAIVRKGA